MNKRGFVVFLSIAFLLGFVPLLLIFFLVNPYTAAWYLVLTFFISFVISLTSLISLINYFLRNYFASGKTNYLPLGTILRQSFLISICLIGLLLLKAARVLNFWDGFLLILAVLLIELYYKQ